jgi:hypothetical protein
MHESAPTLSATTFCATCSHLFGTCSAGQSHLFRHLLCWKARISIRAAKPLISGKNLIGGAPGQRLTKDLRLLKQVEQVNTAHDDIASAQQNAIQGCDPASFGPRPRVK